MGILDSLFKKTDPNDVFDIVVNGLRPIANDWIKSIENVYSKEFEQFITNDTTLGYLVGFVDEICNALKLKNEDLFWGVLGSSLRASFGNYFNNNDEWISLIEFPLNAYLVKVSIEKNTPSSFVIGRAVGTMYLNRLDSPNHIVVYDSNGKIGKFRSKFYVLIEDAPAKFCNKD